MAHGRGGTLELTDGSWNPVDAAGDEPADDLAGVAEGLLGRALASDDAEAWGLRADDVLSNPEAALVMLGGPDGWPAARHAVIQRYGRVGALLVVGYEGRFRARRGTVGHPNPPQLEGLLDRFAAMDARELCAVLDAVEAERLDAPGAAVADAEETSARHWLEATYAVAARDGTRRAHRAYMAALDRVMRLAARRLVD